MIIRDQATGGFVRANQALEDRLGWTSAELAERDAADWIHDDDRTAFCARLEARSGSVQARHQSKAGEWVALEWQVRAEGHDLVLLGCEATGYSVDPADAVEPLPRDDFSETLDAMVRFVEGHNPGLKCSVLLLGPDGRVSVGAGPSLPATYNAKVEGLAIGYRVGSCGTAAYWNVPVLVEDIHKDPLWRDLDEYASKAELAACWSHPFTGSHGQVLGALALYCSEPRGPTEEELRGLETAARMVGLAVERLQAETALRKSEADATAQSRLLSAITEVVTSYVDRGDWPSAGQRLVRSALQLTSSELGFFGVMKGTELQVVSREGEGWKEPVERPYGLDPRFEGLFVEVLKSARPLILSEGVEPANDDSRILRSFLGAPIVHGGEVVAMLGVASQTGDYSEEDRRAAEYLGRAARVMFDSHERRDREARLESQLNRAGKMEALGVMAGGVAHDFNNMLATVMGNAELALTTLTEDAPAAQMLREITMASVQATELCNQMLAYAGRGVRSTSKLEINGLIQELGSLLRVSLSKKADLHFEVEDAQLFIEADRAQMQQVIMNLITNAGEALEGGGGRIRVTSRTRYFRDAELRAFQPSSNLKAGDYVRLVVEDNGSGMDKETQTRIFDPFFTTKFAGRGLGLAAVQGIVLAHKGIISLQSEPGKGTTFVVLFPRVDPPIVSPVESPACTVDHSGSLLLVVDDEPKVRSIQTKILQNAGFDVIQAADGEEATEIFRTEGSSIDCVLLDLSMPKLDGVETFQELRRLQADVRVILTSGYTQGDVVDRFHEEGFAAVLQKPTPSKLLVSTIHAVLSTRRPARNTPS
jgi:signal transduction histidine kinase/ActR/RegA family two-component response regulator